MIKKVKQVKVPMVVLEVEVTERFYEEMQAAKQSLKEKYDWDLSDGEYLERCMEDLIIMISTLERENQLLHQQGHVAVDEDNDIFMGDFF